MDNKLNITEDMLWDYADGLLSPSEKSMLEQQLSQSPAWKAKLDEIMQSKDLLQHFPLEHPDRNFSDQVMAAWTGVQIQAKTSKLNSEGKDWVLILLASGFGLFIMIPIVLLIATALNSGAAALSTPLKLPQYNLPNFSNILQSGSVSTLLVATLAITMLLLMDKFLRQRKALAAVAP